MITLKQHYCGPIYYWTERSGWRTIVDSSNIGKYTVKKAQYIPVELRITVSSDPWGDAVFDLTYYQAGEKKTINSSINAEESKTFTISADMGSVLSLSNNYSFYSYEIDDLPLVEKSDTSAEGSFAYKLRFIVIGGGDAEFYLSGKG